MKIFIYAMIGFLFGLGITISGMIDPNKVLNFFDLAGDWDPSLLFVMGGGLLVNLVGLRVITKTRATPLVEGQFPPAPNQKIEPRLVLGSALFGVGWGIAGFCPGAALPALGALNVYPLYFVLALVAGMGLTRLVLRGMRSAV